MKNNPKAEMPSAQHEHPQGRDPLCLICRLEKPFRMPEEIVQALYERKLVLFAGAGISSESRQAFPYSLVDTIKSRLGISASEKTSFPKLMSRYCSPPRGRRALYQVVKERLDSMKAFPEVYLWASRFHKQLSTIPFVDEIITTNWDDLFEKECDATPIVTSEDFAAFSDVTGRKVLKIHGSINNYGSLVATERDYQKCYRMLRTGLIGGKLKVLLASKVVVFVGYSFEDEDFQRIYRLLKKEVGGLAPSSYIVTLDEGITDKIHTGQIETSPIITDGAFFSSKLKKRAVKDKRMLPDDKFAMIPDALEDVRKASQ